MRVAGRGHDDLPLDNTSRHRLHARPAAERRLVEKRAVDPALERARGGIGRKGRRALIRSELDAMNSNPRTGGKRRLRHDWTNLSLPDAEFNDIELVRPGPAAGSPACGLRWAPPRLDFDGDTVGASCPRHRRLIADALAISLGIAVFTRTLCPMRRGFAAVVFSCPQARLSRLDGCTPSARDRATGSSASQTQKAGGVIAATRTARLSVRFSA